MKLNQFLGIGLISSIVFTLFIAVVIDPSEADGWYTFAGYIYFVFAIWGGIRLLKS